MKLRILNRVYDTHSGEYIQRTYTWEVTEEEHKMLTGIFARQKPEIKGFGADDDLEELCLDTPIADKKRFMMLTDFGVINEVREQMNGIIDL